MTAFIQTICESCGKDCQTTADSLAYFDHSLCEACAMAERVDDAKDTEAFYSWEMAPV